AAGDDAAAAYDAALAALAEGRRHAFEEMTAARRETARAKIDAAIEHIKESLESSTKIVVFAHHKDIIDRLVSDLGDYGAVRVDGSTPMAERQTAVDRFQSDEDCRVFVGSIGAAGVGLTLTASSHVIFVEFPWTPSEISQAEDRCHRIGQANSVLV